MLQKVIDILVERDELTPDEAKDLIDETREMIIRNPDEADEIMLEQLGLEPDYIFDVLGF